MADPVLDAEGNPIVPNEQIPPATPDPIVPSTPAPVVPPTMSEFETHLRSKVSAEQLKKFKIDGMTDERERIGALKVLDSLPATPSSSNNPYVPGPPPPVAYKSPSTGSRAEAVWKTQKAERTARGGMYA